VRRPVPPTQEATPEWMTLVSQNSYDIRLISQALDVTSVAANTTDEQTFTVTGLKSEDMVISVNKPSHSTGLGVTGFRVSADDTLAITFMNTTAGAIDPASETYNILVLKNRI